MSINPRTYVEYRSGDSLGNEVSIPDGDVNTEYANVPLIGKRRQNSGESYSEGLLWLLENYASNLSPSPRVGQLWFDTSSNTLRICEDVVESTPTWVNVNSDSGSTSTGDSDIIPASTNTLNVGSEDAQWEEAHALNVFWDELLLNGTDIASVVEIDSNFVSYDGTAASFANLSITETLNSLYSSAQNTRNIIPFTSSGTITPLDGNLYIADANPTITLSSNTSENLGSTFSIVGSHSLAMEAGVEVNFSPATLSNISSICLTLVEKSASVNRWVAQGIING